MKMFHSLDVKKEEASNDNISDKLLQNGTPALKIEPTADFVSLKEEETNIGSFIKGRIGRKNRRSQILALPKKKGGRSDPCQEFVGEFDIWYRGQTKVIIAPQR